MRQPVGWLVVDVAPDCNGHLTELIARAAYDEDGDLLTVTGPGGQRDSTQVAGHPVRVLAKSMLRGMFRREQDAIG